MANARSETFITPEAIIVYPHLLTKSASTEGGKETYSVTLLFDKKTDMSSIKGALNEAFQKGFPGQKPNGSFKNPIHDGDEAPDKWGEAFKGKWYIRISTERKPIVIDSAKQDITNEDEIYSGQYARAAVSAYAFNVNGNRGVAFGFNAIMITRDGERIGSDPRSMFDEYTGADAHKTGTTVKDLFGGTSDKNDDFCPF